jgi:hypothetical protein
VNPSKPKDDKDDEVKATKAEASTTAGLLTQSSNQSTKKMYTSLLPQPFQTFFPAKTNSKTLSSISWNFSKKTMQSSYSYIAIGEEWKE